MKIKLILLFLMAFSYTFAQTKPTMQYVVTEKNPGISFALSAIIPGAGEMYNDQVGLGLAIFFGDAAIMGSGYAVYSQYNSSSVYHNDFNLGVATFLITTGVVIDVAQLVYAPLYSRHLNSKNGFSATSMNLKLKGSQLALSYNF